MDQDISCTLFLVLLVMHRVSGSCFGKIEGLYKFSTRINDSVLFFDTTTNSRRQQKSWHLTPFCDLYSMLNTSFDATVNMNRTSEGSGMHRKVTTTVKLPGNLLQATSDCYAMFAEHVSTSFSLDIYEIERTAAYHIYYNSSIDIENTSYQSRNHTVLVFRPLLLKDDYYEASFTLNWHLRYHKPSKDDYYVKVTLPSPSVHLFCYGNNSIYELCDLDILKDKTILAPCPDVAKKTLCAWVKSRSIQIDNELQFTWPIGITNHQPYVTFFTLLITWSSTLYIIFKILKSNCRTS